MVPTGDHSYPVSGGHICHATPSTSASLRVPSRREPRRSIPSTSHRRVAAEFASEVACHHPIPARRDERTGSVKFLRVRDRTVYDGAGPELLRIPCGTCLGCVKSRAREWALRCTLELNYHPEACWCTLTYDDKYLPPTLDKFHLSRFMRRLRKEIHPARVRFFGAGEYGEKTYRPHYHAILFGLPQHTAHVQAAWPHGYAQVDHLTPAAVSYVAGYCAKKIGWKLERGERIDYSTGEVYDYEPPFVLMSRRPGIGASAREHWRSWRSFAVLGGNPMPVPRFLHQAWRDQASPEDLRVLEEEKLDAFNPSRMTDYALRAREAIAISLSSINADKRGTM